MDTPKWGVMSYTSPNNVFGFMNDPTPMVNTFHRFIKGNIEMNMFNMNYNIKPTHSTLGLRSFDKRLSFFETFKKENKKCAYSG